MRRTPPESNAFDLKAIEIIAVSAGGAVQSTSCFWGEIWIYIPQRVQRGTEAVTYYA